MCDVSSVLSAIHRGDRTGAEKLLPLVYDELRKLAAQRMAQERPGQTLDATALVHEASLRRRPRPCDESSSKTRAASGGSSMAGNDTKSPSRTSLTTTKTFAYWP